MTRIFHHACGHAAGIVLRRRCFWDSGLGGAAGGVAAAGMARFASAAADTPAMSSVFRGAQKVMGSKVFREGVASSVDNVVNNDRAYIASNNAKNPWDFAVGLGRSTVSGTVFGFAAPGANKILSGNRVLGCAADKFPVLVGNGSTRERAIKTRNLTKVGTDWLSERLSGGAAGYGNAWAQPDSQRSDQMAGAGNGTVRGGSGERFAKRVLRGAH